MGAAIQSQYPLDYENVNQRYGFNVTINVTDGRHWSTGRLRIKLLDQNDNAPRFLDPQGMVVRVVEGADVGEKVHLFRAYDPDFDGKDQF
uniref:Cadherin domain-containing protein n=1 Tax=Romanomermis culicivorax TaxID=13658 RepID=A0A915JE48_ROMCU